MMRHINAEESIVFPRINQLEQNGFELVPFDIKHYQYLELPIIDMEDDDEDVYNKMDTIRMLTNNYTPPADSCTTFKLLYASLGAFEIDLLGTLHRGTAASAAVVLFELMAAIALAARRRSRAFRRDLAFE